MTKQNTSGSGAERDRPVQEIEITEAMVDAGVDVLIEMIGEDYSNADRAKLVYQAMAEVCLRQAELPTARQNVR